MKKYQYRALHVAVKAVWGDPNKCEVCNNTKGSKRFEWSNKDHKYTLKRKDWWELCAKCHRQYDNKKFGKVAWNKGNRKIMPERICEYCMKRFRIKRNEQIYCSRHCSSTVNGYQPKLCRRKKKRIYLLENKLT